MVSLLGLTFALMHVDMVAGPPALVFQLTVAFLYMPMPFVAGLIVERVAGRRALLRDTCAGFGRKVAAGFTINGLFAFGEEYGWRGVLMDELRPLGTARANVLTGILWGLWHAPIILLGFNYGQQRILGVLTMAIAAIAAWSLTRGSLYEPDVARTAH